MRTPAKRTINLEAEYEKNRFFNNFCMIPQFVIQFLKNKTMKIKALSLITMSYAKIIVNQNKLSLVECFDQPKMKEICNYKWFLLNQIVLLCFGGEIQDR